MTTNKQNKGRLHEFEVAAQKAVDHLYSIDESCPSELRLAIAILRQLINEEYLGKNKSVSSQLIWDLLKPDLLAWKNAQVEEAMIEYQKELLKDYESDVNRRVEQAKLEAYEEGYLQTLIDVHAHPELANPPKPNQDKEIK